MRLLTLLTPKARNSNTMMALPSQDLTGEILHAKSHEEVIQLLRSYSFDVLLLNTPGSTAETLALISQIQQLETPPGIVYWDDRTLSYNFTTSYLRAGAHSIIMESMNHAIVWAILESAARKAFKGLPALIEAGGLAIFSDGTCKFLDKSFSLTKTEFVLLKSLALGAGRILTKEILHDAIYYQGGGAFDNPELKIVDVFVCKLRAKLRAIDPRQTYIQTIWGKGYKFEIQETSSDE